MSTHSILENYAQLRRTLAGLKSAEKNIAEFGHNQILVLYRLSLSDATMTELVEYCLSDKASMTRTISALVKQGMVRRHADQADRRVVRIELTNKGKEKAQAAKKIRDRIGKRLEHALAPKERELFIQLIQKMIHNLQAP